MALLTVGKLGKVPASNRPNLMFELIVDADAELQ